MKKYFLTLLVVLLVLSGCTAGNIRYDDPVKFYYIQNEVEYGTQSGVIKETTREAKGHRNDYTYLINQYLNGPISYDCISPFPAGTALEELSWDQNRVQIILSPHIATLSGADLIVACACLTKTVADITGIQTVQIRAQGSLLNGEEVLVLSTDSFDYWDQSGASDSFD